MSHPDTTSYWQATYPIAPLGQALPAEVDLAVVGGGVLGAATAYFAACGGARVALLEQKGVAWGASGRNGGFITEGAALSYTSAIKRFGRDTARAIWQVTCDNRALARQIIGEERLDCWYREAGNLKFSLSESELAEDTANVAAMEADGFGAEMLTRAQTQALVGTALGPMIRGARYASYAGLVHSTRLVGGLAAAAQTRGAALVEASVTRIEHGKVTTTAGAIKAGAVVIAANAWISQLVPETRDLILPVRGQALSYAPTAPVFGPGMGAAVTPTGEYWQQTLDGSIVIGGARAARPDKDVGALRHDTSDDVQHGIEAVLPALFPALPPLQVTRRWAGPMAFTPDYVPLADHAPGEPNIWFAGGFCGHGMPFGLIFGKLLAQAALGGDAGGLGPFRLGRLFDQV